MSFTGTLDNLQRAVQMPLSHAICSNVRSKKVLSFARCCPVSGHPNLKHIANATLDGSPVQPVSKGRSAAVSGHKNGVNKVAQFAVDLPYRAERPDEPASLLGSRLTTSCRLGQELSAECNLDTGNIVIESLSY